MSYLVIGTAGHIDHGKTSLVKALTGIDTDRLKEEKSRGITIELGFAHLDLPDSPPVGIVDVPGHEKFVHHMVAGVTGIDLVLLVIAADEGIMPQTREHLDICRLLGVRRGVVALTKLDLVEADWLEMVRDEIRTFTAGSFLEESPVVPVSAATGEGLDTLREELRAALASIPPRPASSLPRLPVDRVFTMKGFGTVVTGTLLTGHISTGDTVQVLPGGREYRVRGLQVHGHSVDRVAAGQRTAVNLQGAEKTALRRGDTLTLPGAIRPSYLIDARLHHLPSAPRPLANRTRVRLHIGTSEIFARVVVLGQEHLDPGEDGMVQFRLEEPGVALPRDRFVIRSYSPMVTLGGGELIDTHPSKHRKFSKDALRGVEILAGEDRGQSALLLLSDSGVRGLGREELADRLNIEGTDAMATLERLAGRKEAIRVPGKPPLFLHAAAFDELAARLLDILAVFHREEPLKPGLSKEELRSRLRPAGPKPFAFLLEHLQDEKKVKVEKDLVRLAGHRVQLRSDQAELKKRVEDYFRRAGLAPPVYAVIAGDLGIDAKSLKEAITLLVGEQRLVKISEELSLHAESIGPLGDKVASFLKESGKIDMQDFKEISGLSRKYSIPIMEYFDRTGLTLRVEDHRVLRKTV